MIYQILRIAKVIRRKDFYVFPDIKIKKESYGNTHAAWTIHPKTITKESVIYSFGVGTDVSFDTAMMEKFGVSIHAFDPTPKSADWISTQKLSKRFLFYKFGLASYNGPAEFALPDNPNHVSATILQKNSKQGFFQAEVKTLGTIMNELGHSRIEILKMDIEGAEYDVIDDILNSGIDISQVLIEFHHRFANIGIEKSKHAIKKLKNAGYKIFDVSATGEEISFIKQ